MLLKRCPWCLDDEKNLNYHDYEWGKPNFDDNSLFEFLILETFQTGLSWKIIINKRDDIKKYLLLNPNIQRAKGWVCEENGIYSLLQMTPSGCNFSPSSFKSQTRIVFIYTGKLSPFKF